MRAAVPEDEQFLRAVYASTRAEELAMLITTAIEGAIVVARASRDLKPLDLVHGQLRDLLQADMSERKTSDGR